MELPEFLTDQPGGEIRLKGHRVGLYDVVYYHRLGEDAEALGRRFSGLPAALIAQALDFIATHPREVDSYVASCEADLDRLRRSTPPGPSREALRARLASRSGAGVD